MITPGKEWRVVLYRTVGRDVERSAGAPIDRATAVKFAAGAHLAAGERADVERYVKGHWTLVARRAAGTRGLASLSVDFAPEVNREV